jgi:hydrogenase maturation protease
VSFPRAVLIGVGNSYRRDDGIGPAIVAAIAESQPPGVRLTVSAGEPSELLDAWSGVPLAVVVDAVLCDPPAPGQIHRSTVNQAAPGTASASTHGLGIPDAVRLAEALDRTPHQLVVFAVEAADVGFGLGLSPAVAASLPELTRAVRAELGLAPPATRCGARRT